MYLQTAKGQCGRLGFTGRSQGGQALTGRPGLSKGGCASHREAKPLIGRLVLSQGGWASHREGRASSREARPLAGWSMTPGQASHKEDGPLTGRLDLPQGGWASHREARPLTGRPAFLREAGPLSERQSL